MAANHGHPKSYAGKVKRNPLLGNEDDDDINNNLDFSLTGEGNILLDQETLANVADFIDKLHRTRRDHGSNDRNDDDDDDDNNNNKEFLSPRSGNTSDRDGTIGKLEMDARTKSSVGRFISVLSQEEEELAAELSNVVRSVSFDEDFEVASVNPETLEAIGQYIDNASKKNRVLRNDSASLTGSSSHETSEKKDGSKEGVLESNFTNSSRDGSSVGRQTENTVHENGETDQILQMDDMSETTGIEPDTLAAIGDYIDRARSHTSKEKTVKISRSKRKTSFTPQNETSENDDGQNQIAVEQSASEDTIDRVDLPPETLETIGEYIDSVSLPPNASASCYSRTKAAQANSSRAEEERSRHFVEDVLDNSREEGAELLSESMDLDYGNAQNGASEIAVEQKNTWDSYEQRSRTELEGGDADVSPESPPSWVEKQPQDILSAKASPTAKQNAPSPIRYADSGKDFVPSGLHDDHVHQNGVPGALSVNNYPNRNGHRLLSEDFEEKTDGKVYDDNTITTKGTLDIDHCQFDHFVKEIEALQAEERGELNSIEALDEIFGEIDRSFFSESLNSNLLAMIEEYVEKFTAVHLSNDETTYDSSKVPEEARAVVSEFIDLVQKKKTLGENKVRDFESRLPEHLQKFRLKQPGLKSCPRDPPSITPLTSKTSNCLQRDPPLKMSLSEEKRIHNEDQPEKNLKAERKRRTETEFDMRDPEATSAEPLFDTTGELAKKATGNTPKDSSHMKIQNSQTPKPMTLLSVKNEFLFASKEEKKDDSNPVDQNQPSSLAASPKLEILSGCDSDSADPVIFFEDIGRLARLLSPSIEPSADEMKKLAYVVSYAYPHVNGKSAPASSVARILCEARNHQLDLNVIDRFLNLAHAYFEAQGGGTYIETVPSDELIAAKASWRYSSKRGQSVKTNEVLDYVRRIVNFGEANPRFVPRKEEDEEDVDLIITADGEDEAIEIDLKDGFVNKEMALGATGEAPWWEIAARLSGGSFVGASDGIFSSESEKADDYPFDGESVEGHKSVHESDHNSENFKKYWEGRQNRFWKPFGYPSKTIEENEHSGLIEQRISDEWVTPSLSTGVSVDSLEEAWLRRQSMALWKEKSHSIWATSKNVVTVPVDDPAPINAVAATADMFVSGTFRQRMRKQLPLTKQWKRTYQDRTEDHTGFFGVHVYSLYDATCPVNSGTQQDGKPWEYRIVKQRFLYEQSVSFCKNWFGVLLPKKGNPVAKNPVVRIQSMPMPIKASEWSEDWYQNPWVIHEPEDSPKDTATKKRRSYFNNNVDNISLLEAPECGRIRNTRLKIGERVSRVTPDLTSSLRRSRWRKKHFPRGTFPY